MVITLGNIRGHLFAFLGSSVFGCQLFKDLNIHSMVHLIFQCLSICFEGSSYYKCSRRQNHMFEEDKLS